MQPHRYRLVQNEARHHIDALPPPPGPRAGPTYHAERRVTGVPVGRYAIHESDGDLPICQLGGWFAEKNIPREQLGPGQVDCGHCAYMNA